MIMENFIVAAILIVIIGAAVYFLARAKKRGAACIGCPHAKQCGRGCACKETAQKTK